MQMLKLFFKNWVFEKTFVAVDTAADLAGECLDCGINGSQCAQGLANLSWSALRHQLCSHLCRCAAGMGQADGRSSTLIRDHLAALSME
jgi:hypothetical protein